MSAVDILRNEPNLTAAELAERAGVTLQYANGLVRRKRPRAATPPPESPSTPARPFLAAFEKSDDRVRTQILDASNSGSSVLQIAEQLRLVPGEVEFALKVARLVKKA
jgi:hypothetical protein